MRKPKTTTASAAKAADDLSYINFQLRLLAIPVGSVVLDPENVRLHSERNIEAICSSLKRFGQRKLIVVQASTMKVVAGNGTVVAAKRLGWTHVAANVVDCSDEDAAAFGVADNRTAELAEWDFQGLNDLMTKYELDPMQHALGFTPDELSSIMQSSAWDEDTEPAKRNDVDGEEAVAAVIKVKVLDLPFRPLVQEAIAELLQRDDLKRLAKLV